MEHNSKYMIGFPISEELYNKSVEFVTKSMTSDKPSQYTQELVNIIHLMTDVGLNYFFVESLKQAQIGMLSQNAIKMGLNSGKKAVLMVASKIIKGMNDKQMAEITIYMKNILEHSNKTNLDTHNS